MAAETEIVEKSSQIVELKENKMYSMDESFSYFIEDSREYTFEEIVGKEFYRKFQVDPPGINMGIVNSGIWVKIQYRGATKNKWMLYYGYAKIDFLDLYQQTSGGVWEKKRYGDMLPFSQREVDYHKFILPLENASQGEKIETIYIKLTSTGSLLLPFQIGSDTAIVQYISDEKFYYGIYYGIALAMIVINLMISIVLPQRAYIFYILYLIMIVLTQVSLDGLSQQLLWPDALEWNDRSLYMFIGGTVFFGGLFTREFLNIKQYSKFINYLMTIVIILGGVTMALSFSVQKTLVVKMSSLVNLIFPLVCMGIGFYVLYLGNKAARFFIVAWTFLGISIFLTSGLYMAIYTASELMTKVLPLGTILEMVFLSFAIGDKIILLRKEKEESDKILLNQKEEALEKQKALNDAFARFVPTEFLTYLNKKSVQDVRLGDSVQKEMVVLFSDIRGFTSLSEKMTPAENFKFLNAFYKRICPAIRERSGFIDKYIGDGIMALFPGSPEEAIQAGIEMKKAVTKFNKAWKRLGYPEISIGIGIHSGILMLGTIGENKRMEGTVISDAVNLASRIEGLTKKYGVTLITTADTLQKVGDANKFLYRKLGETFVKGKEKSVSIVEIYDGEPDALMKDETLHDFHLGVECFSSSKFDQAIELFQRVLIKNPEDKAAQNLIELGKIRSSNSGFP